MNETLESFSCIAEPEGHPHKPEPSKMGGHLDFGMYALTKYMQLKFLQPDSDELRSHNYEESDFASTHGLLTFHELHHLG